MILQFGLQIISSQNPRLFIRSDKIKRDFVFVEDIIQANIKACNSKKAVFITQPRERQEVFKILLIYCKANLKQI